jgi:large subunit ribosomal protein L35
LGDPDSQPFKARQSSHNQDEFMPKMKTHKGASKRFKKTGTGKIARRHAFARHILTSKPRSRKRKLGHGVIADEADQAKLRTMLPY